MIYLLFMIYVMYLIRKIYHNNYNWHSLSCGGDDDDSDAEAKYNAAVAPNRQYDADMQELFKNIYKPYVEDIGGLWSKYGKPTSEAESQYYLETGLPQKQALTTASYEDYMNLMRPAMKEQFGLYQDVYAPAQRELGAKLRADVENPWLNTKPIFENIWRQTREKTAAEWNPIEQRTSQRLAGAGALDTGASLKAFGDIEQAKYKSNESMAIDQALQEFNLQNQAKQSSYSNMFQYLSGNQLPTVNPSVAANPQINTSAITGTNYQPQLIPPYTQKQEDFDWLTPLLQVGGTLGAAGIMAASGGTAAAAAPLILTV